MENGRVMDRLGTLTDEKELRPVTFVQFVDEVVKESDFHNTQPDRHTLIRGPVRLRPRSLAGCELVSDPERTHEQLPLDNHTHFGLLRVSDDVELEGHRAL